MTVAQSNFDPLPSSNEDEVEDGPHPMDRSGTLNFSRGPGSVLTLNKVRSDVGVFCQK